MRSEFVNALFRYPLSEPVFVRFGVALDAVLALENSHIQFFHGNAEPLRRRHQVPREGDRFLLEIIAEREIAEHLEKSVVAIGEAHVFQVVVLAARTDAFLAGSGPAVIALFGAQKDVFELVHPGIGEKQGGIVHRDKRRAADDAVPVAFKELQERLSDFVAGHRGFVVIRLALGSGRTNRFILSQRDGEERKGRPEERPDKEADGGKMCFEKSPLFRRAFRPLESERSTRLAGSVAI